MKKVFKHIGKRGKIKDTDCAKKLDHFLKSVEEIDVQYKQFAFAEYYAILVNISEERYAWIQFGYISFETI